MSIVLLFIFFLFFEETPTPASSLVIPGSSYPAPPPSYVPAANAPSIAPTSVDGHTQWTDFGPVVPQLSTAYRVAAPIAKYVTTPIVHAANAVVGGASPYADLKPNGDGTYTDGLGAHVVVNADGTVTRHNPPFSQTNGGKVIIAAGHGLATAGKAVGHAASATYHFFTSIF